jgi:Leucine-rich repeat (LRR) protein
VIKVTTFIHIYWACIWSRGTDTMRLLPLAVVLAALTCHHLAAQHMVLAKGWGWGRSYSSRTTRSAARFSKDRTYGRWQASDFGSSFERRMWCWVTGDTECRASQPFLVEVISANVPDNPGNVSLSGRVTLFDPNAHTVHSSTTDTLHDWKSDPNKPVWSQQLAVGWPDVHAGNVPIDGLLYLEVFHHAMGWFTSTNLLFGSACVRVHYTRSSGGGGTTLERLHSLLLGGGGTTLELPLWSHDAERYPWQAVPTADSISRFCDEFKWPSATNVESRASISLAYRVAGQGGTPDIDTDNDGLSDKDEMAAWLRDQDQPDRDEAKDQARSELDFNEDGELDLEEIESAVEESDNTTIRAQILEYGGNGRTVARTVHPGALQLWGYTQTFSMMLLLIGAAAAATAFVAKSSVTRAVRAGKMRPQLSAVTTWPAVQAGYNYQVALTTATRDAIANHPGNQVWSHRWGDLKSLQFATCPAPQATAVMLVPSNDIRTLSGMGFPHLRQLDVSNNDLTSLLGIEAASGLQALDASNNDLRHFGRLSLCGQLEWLDLSSNDLTSLSSAEHLPGTLRFVNLSNNDLATACFALPHLECLDLSDNEITELDHRSAAGCPQLRTLALDGNDLGAGPFYALSGNVGIMFRRSPNLLWLGLAGNDLGTEEQNSLREVMLACDKATMADAAFAL